MRASYRIRMFLLKQYFLVGMPLFKVNASRIHLFVPLQDYVWLAMPGCFYLRLFCPMKVNMNTLDTHHCMVICGFLILPYKFTVCEFEKTVVKSHLFRILICLFIYIFITQL